MHRVWFRSVGFPCWSLFFGMLGCKFAANPSIDRKLYKVNSQALFSPESVKRMPFALFGGFSKLITTFVEKTPGTVPAFCSNRAVHKRPKFTAKAQSSPSPRTRKEVPGADPPIANRKNSGTVPSFVSGDLNKPPSSSVWARTSQQPRLPTPAIPSNRAVHKLPKFTAKAPSSPSPRTRRKAPAADPPIMNRKN
jgi:hypothetical protein